MLGKVPKLRYSEHDVHDATEFHHFSEEAYLVNTGEIGPLGKPIMEPVQWIIGLYNSRAMNLLDIPHFGRCKNVGIFIKKLLARVHGDILWMDRPLQLDVALIAKSTILPTQFGTRISKDITELVKSQFGTSRGNRGIVLRDINDNITRFSNKIMA
jgi:hypothetical protein